MKDILLEKIYQSYSFVLTKEEIKDIIYNNEDYKKEIYRKIHNKMKDNILFYTKKYIECKFNDKNALEKINSLENLYQANAIKLEIDDYEDLLKIDEINDAVREIVNTNSFQSKKDINKKIKGKRMQTLIYLYCINQNIFEEKVEEELSVNSDDISLNDPVRLYYDELRRYSLLTKEDEQELFKRLEMNDQTAKEKIIQSNLRLVAHIARHYVNNGFNGLSLADLIQEGNLGLIKAVKDFDYTKGYKFSTYATWWIDQAIKRAITNDSRTVRIPSHLIESMKKMDKITASLEQELGRTPSVREIANKLNCSTEKVSSMLDAKKDILSIDQEVSQEKDADTLSEFIADDKDLTDDLVINSTLRPALEELMDKHLEEREKEVLMLRFGLVDGINHTLEDIRIKYNVTRERVRQIESKALIKLRNAKDGKDLMIYLGKDKNVPKEKTHYDFFLAKDEIERKLHLLSLKEQEFLKRVTNGKNYLSWGSWKELGMIDQSRYEYIMKKLKKESGTSLIRKK